MLFRIISFAASELNVDVNHILTATPRLVSDWITGQENPTKLTHKTAIGR